jgi:hypothetical protein
MMVRKKILIRKKDNKIMDAGLAESSNEPVDPEVSQEFEEAKRAAGSGSSLLEQKLREYNAETPQLTAKDVDAQWERADAGDETVGGDNMTPDQSVVEDIGRAVGMTHDDAEPLRTSVEEKSIFDSSGTRSNRIRSRKHSKDAEESRDESRQEPMDW